MENLDQYSHNELTDLLNAVKFSAQCCSTEDIQELLIIVKTIIGAEYSICAIGKVKKDGSAEVLRVVNGDYPNEWLKIYTREKLYNIDPVVRHHTRFCGTQFWADTFRQYTDSETQRFYKRAAVFGLKYGISSGVYIPGVEVMSIFSFGGSQNIYNDHHKQIVDIVTLHIHKAFVRVFQKQSPIKVFSLTNYSPDDFCTIN